MIRLALLSCWNPYHTRSFVRDLAEYPEARLVAVWDDDHERGTAHAAEFGLPFEPSLTALLDRADIDGVIIDSSPAQAASLIELAAQAGKHALADQTLAMTLREAEQVASHIRRANIRFAVDMSLKRWPINLAAANAARSGALGEVTCMRVRNAHHSAIAATTSFASRFLDAPYGVFSDLGAHGLYLTHDILGRPDAVTAVVSRFTGHSAEDNAVCVMEYANGTIAICETSYVAGQSPFAIELYGTEGSFLGGGANGIHRKLLQPSDAVVRAYGMEEQAELARDASEMPDAAEASTLSNWLEAIELAKKRKESNGSSAPDNELPAEWNARLDDAIALAELLEALYLSAETGRKVYLRDFE
ncbi:Gfo/Idh/MocA family protein [Cohnella sp.]|uniref:Gfo/Idh/MocA family protein n=1 Tax=Cohnella sp. TaxID=1883426 RepID=UPI00370414BE